MDHGSEESLRKDVTALCKYRRVPGTKGHEHSREYLTEQLKALGFIPHVHEFKPLFVGPSYNIYAETPEAMNRPPILIGAHYDSRGCSGAGADDNASACAVVLETARLIRELKVSAVFVFFDLEEYYRGNFLRGSRAFAKYYPRKLDRVIILDLVGGALVPGFENIYLQFGNGLPKLESSGARYLHLPRMVVEPFGEWFDLGARSDYVAFRKRKIPYTFISVGSPWYYHTLHDTIDRLHFDKMAALSQTLADVLVERPEPPRKKEPDFSDFEEMMKIFVKMKAFQNPTFQKFVGRNKRPSRLEIISMYGKALKTIRHHGSRLFDQSRPTS